MEHDDYIAALRANTAALSTAARRTPMDARVPSCPDWTMKSLVDHLGIHHRWVAANLERAFGDGMFPFGDVDPPPGPAEVVDWLEEGAETLAAKLATTGPTAPCWTWTDDHTSGFWSRRTAHETTMHSWDGQNATGSPPTIAAPFAADGIDEYLTIVPFRFRSREPRGDDDTIHLHCTDTPGEWLVRLDARGTHVTREHAKGDVAVRGAASDLLLVVYGRKPADAVEVFGDASLLARWQEQTKF